MPAKLTSSADTPVDYWFVGLDGEPQPLGYELEEIARDGFDGHAFRKQPLKSQPFELTGFITCPAADVATHEAALMALQGTLISYTDHRGRTFSDLACLAVRVLSTRRILSASGAIDIATGTAGSGHDRMVTFGFVLQQT